MTGLATPLHAQPAVGVPLLAVLLVAGVGSAALLRLALSAFVRRRSRPYLLVALAVGTLLARTALAGLALLFTIPAGSHHLAEHSLDVAMAALVIGAVYYARTTERRLAGGGS